MSTNLVNAVSERLEGGGEQREGRKKGGMVAGGREGGKVAGRKGERRGG